MLLIRPLSISGRVQVRPIEWGERQGQCDKLPSRAQVFAARAMLTVIADGVSRTTCRRRPWRRSASRTSGRHPPARWRSSQDADRLADGPHRGSPGGGLGGSVGLLARPRRLGHRTPSGSAWPESGVNPGEISVKVWLYPRLDRDFRRQAGESWSMDAERVPPGAWRFDRFTLDLGRRALLGPDGTEVPLRPKSFALLRLLVENAGRVVDRDAIMAAVWPDVVVTDESITQCVRDIRKTLGDEAQQVLKTVPGTATCSPPRWRRRRPRRKGHASSAGWPPSWPPTWSATRRLMERDEDARSPGSRRTARSSSSRSSPSTRAASSS